MSSRDLDEAERYAAAALFTLALHIIQVETGQHGEPEAAWGEPYDDGSGVDTWAAAAAAAAAAQAAAASSSSMSSSASSAPADAAAAAAAARAAFWGFDCVATGGLLERAYAHLGVPKRAWAGLKRLPDVAGVGGSERGAFGECVARHAAQLGAGLSLASSPSPSSSSSDLAALAAGLKIKAGEEEEEPGREESVDPFSSLAPLPAEPALLNLSPGAAARDDADTDSDLEADMAAEEQRKAAARAVHRERGGAGGRKSEQGEIGGGEGVSFPSSSSPPPPDSSNGGSSSSGIREAMSAALSSELGEGGVAAASASAAPPVVAAAAAEEEEGGAAPPPQPPPPPPAAVPAGRLPRPPPSAKAVAAMCDLLEGCLATTGAGAADEEKSSTKNSTSSKIKQALTSSSSSSNFRNRGSGIAAPVCGWYDARARVALRRVAHWLGVPWPKVANFEHLLAFSLTLPESNFDENGAKKTATMSKKTSSSSSNDQSSDSSAASSTAALVRRSAWEKGVKAAQVTGAAVGIGALFALTGGLAAPAVAAGVSAAMTAVGGASAAASAAAASAFLTTSAGTALVAGGVGAGGGAFAGSRMARRVGDVKEFGFVELLPGSNGTDGAGANGDWTGSEDEGAVAGREGEAISSDDDDDGEGDEGESSGGEGESSSESDGEGGRRSKKRQPAAALTDPFLASSAVAAPSSTVTVTAKPLAVAPSMEDLLEMELKPLRREAAVGVEGDDEGEEKEREMKELPKATETTKAAAAEAAATTTAAAATPSNGDEEAFEESLHPPSPPRMGRDGGDDEARAFNSTSRSPSQPSLLLPPLDGEEEQQRRREERRCRRKLRKKLKKKKAAAAATVVRPYRRPPLPPLLPCPASATRSPEDSRLAVTLCVGGWARRREDLVDVWRARGLLAEAAASSSSSSLRSSSSSSLARRDAERYALVWESEALINLSDVVAAWVRNQAAQGVIKFALQHWLYAGAAAAAAGPLALVSVSQVIDSAWAMALDRAVKAGRLLAQLLLANRHGGRPVTLIGYSMGARLVFHCLLELSRAAAAGGIDSDPSLAGGGNGAVVEHAVLLGAPVAAHAARWAMARRAVAGRLVNGFSRSDWILGVVFRASSGFVRPAGGLCPVKVPGVENVNLGAVVKGHLDYAGNLPEILELVGIGE